MQLEIGDILVEIGARRSLDAVGVPAEENLVEIEFEDPFLAERLPLSGWRGSPRGFSG